MIFPELGIYILLHYGQLFMAAYRNEWTNLQNKWWRDAMIFHLEMVGSQKVPHCRFYIDCHFYVESSNFGYVFFQNISILGYRLG